MSHPNPALSIYESHVLALLDDGRPHRAEELWAVTGNRRHVVASLRRKGYAISAERILGGNFVYRLAVTCNWLDCTRTDGMSWWQNDDTDGWWVCADHYDVHLRINRRWTSCVGCERWDVTVNHKGLCMECAPRSTREPAADAPHSRTSPFMEEYLPSEANGWFVFLIVAGLIVGAICSSRVPDRTPLYDNEPGFADDEPVDPR